MGQGPATAPIPDTVENFRGEDLVNLSLSVFTTLAHHCNLQVTTMLFLLYEIAYGLSLEFLYNATVLNIF